MIRCIGRGVQLNAPTVIIGPNSRFLLRHSPGKSCWPAPYSPKPSQPDQQNKYHIEYIEHVVDIEAGQPLKINAECYSEEIECQKYSEAYQDTQQSLPSGRCGLSEDEGNISTEELASQAACADVEGEGGTW